MIHFGIQGSYRRRRQCRRDYGSGSKCHQQFRKELPRFQMTWIGSDNGRSNQLKATTGRGLTDSRRHLVCYLNNPHIVIPSLLHSVISSFRNVAGTRTRPFSDTHQKHFSAEVAAPPRIGSPHDLVWLPSIERPGVETSRCVPTTAEQTQDDLRSIPLRS